MVNLVLALVGWLLGRVAFGSPVPLPPADRRSPALHGHGDRHAPPVSIIVPARDEADSLPLLLGDLEVLRPAGCEVIVVDDGSTDRTAAVAAEFDFVRVLPAGEPPEGWLGKPWACHVGATVATNRTLCFLDADVRLGPGALEAVVAEQALRGGLVSVQPWHATERPYEQASALFNVIALMGVGAGRRAPVDGAFGPVMVTDREDYDRVGGHEAVRHEVVEDLALARRYRAADRSVAVFLGDRDLRFRMYPGGIRSLVDGWSKNFASGAATTRLPVLLAIVAWLAGMGTSTVFVVDGVTGAAPLWLGLVLYGAFAAQLYSMLRRVGRFSAVTALLHPLLLAVFFVVFSRSLWLTLVRGHIRWRGRTMPIGSGRRP